MKNLFVIIWILITVAACNSSSDTKSESETVTNRLTYAKDDGGTEVDEAPSTAVSSNGLTSSEESFEDKTITLANADVSSESLAKSGKTEEEATKIADDKRIKEDLTPNIPKLIKNGYLTIEVKDYKAARKSIGELVSKSGGYLGNETESNESYRITNNLTIRVPVKNFEQVMTGLMEAAIKTDSKRIDVQDVGEEYADLQARIIAKQAVEKRYLEILTKASKISDILEVEEKLRVIREETEAAQGRVKYLESQVSFSTITLTFYKTLDEHYTPPSGPGFFSRIWKGLVKGWEALLEIFIAITYLWPLWAVILVLIIILRRRHFKLRIWPFNKGK